MSSKFLKYIEIFWLITAIISSIGWVVSLSRNGFDQLNILVGFMVIMAFAMYLVRKGMRIRMEKFEREQNEKRSKK